MKVCILGSGLTSLTLAKTLVNLGLNVDIFSNVINKKYNKIRTIGISKSNLEFFNKQILNIERICEFSPIFSPFVTVTLSDLRSERSDLRSES